MKLPEDKHLDTGKEGEELAARHLMVQGYKILDRNYRKPWGELDIVAKKGNILHFIEVKTVSRERWEEGSQDDWEPEDNVHTWKKQRLSRIIETYMVDKHVPEEVDFEIDVLAVYIGHDGKLIKIDSLEDVKLD